MQLDKVQPVGSMILIEPYKSATKSKGGLEMDNTSNAASASVRGTIVAVGEDSKYKKGQDILYRRYSVDKLTVITSEGEKEVSLVEEIDVLAIVQGRITKK